MKSCKHCRSLMYDELTVCPHCGRKQKSHKVRNSVLGFFAIMFVIGALINLLAKLDIKLPSSSATEVSKTIEPTIEPIIDVSQFSRISYKELKNIMGKPDDTEKWNNKTLTHGTFKMTIYTYDNDDISYEFIIADDSDSVVRMNISSKNPIKYNNSVNDILPMLGVTETSESCRVISNTGFAYQVTMVSDKIAHIWVWDIDAESKTFSDVKITYNVNYFDM